MNMILVSPVKYNCAQDENFFLPNILENIFKFFLVFPAKKHKYMNNQAKPKPKAPPMLGLKQAPALKKKTKSVSREVEHSIKKKQAQLKPCPKTKVFKKKRHREFGLCYKVPEGEEPQNKTNLSLEFLVAFTVEQ